MLFLFYVFLVFLLIFFCVGWFVGRWVCGFVGLVWF